MAYTYAWSNSATTASITGVVAGTYTVTITDANGCTDTESVTITEPTPVVAAVIVDSNVTCNGFSDGGLTASATGGTGAYTYAWSNSATTASITGVIAGTYTVTVTDANGCTDTETGSVTEPAVLVAAVVVDSNASCAGAVDGGLTASATGGTPAYTYAWSTGATTASVTGLGAGTYTVTVTDANGCTDTETGTVTEPVALTATIFTQDVDCFGDSDGTATAIASGGTPSYTYAWSNGQTSATAFGLTAGTYTLTLTDANGCDSIFTPITITEPDSIAISVASITTPSCFCEGDGAIDIDVTGGTGPYTYTWFGTNTAFDSTNACALNFVYFFSSISGGSSRIFEIEIVGTQAIITEVATIGRAVHIAINPTNNLIYLVNENGGGIQRLDPATGNVGPFVAIAGLTKTPQAVFTDAGELLVGEESLDTIFQVDLNTGATTFYATADILGGDLAISQSGQLINFTRSNGGEMVAINPGGANVSLGSIPATVTGAGLLANGNFLVSAAGATAFVEYDQNGVATGNSFAAVENGSPLTFTSGDIAGRPFVNLFQWDQDSLAQDLDSIPFGFYSVTVEDANGCITVLDSIEVTQPDDLVASLDTTFDVSCFGDSTGSATVAVMGGTMPYTYAWPDGQTTATATGLPAGTYTVTIDDANMCGPEFVVLTIDEPSAAVDASITASTDVSCNGLSDGSATVTATGGTPAYTYLWSNGQTTAMATGLAAGTYTVTVTDALACDDTASVTITEPALLTGTVSTVDVACAGDTTGSATLTASGGTPAYTYAWSNGQITATATGLTAGTYTVTLTDANGCDSVFTPIVITEPAPLMAMVDSITLPSCFCEGDAAIDISVTGGTAPYTYGWVGTNTMLDNNNPCALNFSYYFVNNDGTDTDVYQVEINGGDAFLTLLTSISGGRHIAINPTNNLVYLVYRDGTGFEILDPATGSVGAKTTTAGIGNTPAAAFTEDGRLYVGDAVNDIIYEIDLNTGAPTFYANALVEGADIAFTPGGQMVLFTRNAGGQLYSIDPSGNTLLSNSITSSVTGAALTADGTFIVSSDGNTGFIEYDTTGTATGNVFDATLGGSQFTFDFGDMAGRAFANLFSWDGDSLAQDLDSIPFGFYTVTIVDANGCITSIDSIEVMQPEELMVSIDSVDNALCNGGAGEATADVTGGSMPYTYLWSNGQTTQTATGLTAGTYTVTVNDANNCGPDFASVTITEPDTIAISVDAITDVSCFCDADGAIDISVTGGTAPYTYAWAGTTTALDSTNPCALNFVYYYSDILGTGASQTSDIYQVEISGGTSVTTLVTSFGFPGHLSINPTTNLIYVINGNELRILDPATGTTGAPVSIAGISGITAAVFTDSSTLMVGSSNTDQIFEVNVTTGVATLIGTGPVEGGDLIYTKTGNLLLATKNNGGELYKVNVGGAATLIANIGVSVTGASLTQDDQLLLSTNNAPGFLLFNTDGTNTGIVYNSFLPDGTPLTLSNGDMAGRAFANLFSWDMDSLAQDLDSIPAGFYTVTVLDANGCSQVLDSIQVIQPEELEASIDTIINVACTGDSTASATIAVTGGTMPYTYAWPDGETTATVTGLAAGNYVVTVTDAGMCGPDFVAFTITEPSTAVDVTAVVDMNVSCFGGSDGAATATATGGTPAYTYLWSNGQVTASATGLAAGTYTITVTDSLGCDDTTSVIITEPMMAVDVTIASTDVSCNGGNDGEAVATATGGTTPYTYLWSNGDADSVAQNLMAGTYTVTATDANGCADSATVVITEPTGLMAMVTTDDVDCNGDSTGTASVAVTGGTLPYTFNWSNGDIDSIAGNLAAGTYAVTVADANSCDTVITNIIINEPPAIAITVDAITGTSCFCEDDGAIDISVAGGTAPYTYTWAATPTAIDSTNPCALNFVYYFTDITGSGASLQTIIFEFQLVGGDALIVPVDTLAGDYHIAINPVNNLIYLVDGPNGGVRTLDPASGSLGSLLSFTPAVTGLPQAVFTDNGELLIGSGSQDTIYSVDLGTGVLSFYATADISGGDLAINNAGQLFDFSRASGGIIQSVTVGGGPTTVGTAPATVTGAAKTVAGNFLVSANGNTAFIEYDENGIATGNSFDVLFNGSPFTLGNGDMAGRAFASLYNWDGDSTAQDIDSLPFGFYTITVLDANGCIATLDSIVVPQPDELVAMEDTVLDVACFGDSTGTATVVTMGGNAPYTYAWPDGQTTATATGLAAGTYIVTVTDANDCGPVLVPVEVEEPLTAVDVTAVADQNVSCSGFNDGQATATGSGGTPPYAYLWTDGQMTATATGLVAGTYTVTVSDSLGCTDTASVTITEPTLLTATVATVDVDCFGDTTGSATVTAVGGTPAYTYLWSNGETSMTASNLGAGTYTVTVSDANGCDTIITPIIINEADSIAISVASITSPSCFCEGDGAIDIDVTGGTAPFTYFWNGTNTSLDSTNECSLNFSYYFNNIAGGVSTIYQAELGAGGVAVLNEIAVRFGSGHIAVDPSTSLIYFVEEAGGLVTLNPNTGTFSASTPITGTAITKITAAVFLDNGDLLVGDNNNGTIYSIDVNTGVGTVYGTGPVSGGDLIVDDAGTVYLATKASGGGLWLVNQGGAATLISSGYPANITGASYQSNGNVLLSIDGNNAFVEYDLAGNATGVTYGTNLNGSPLPFFSGDMAGRAFATLFQWDMDSLAQDLSNIPFGFYTVTVVDGNGCIQTLDSIEVTQPDELIVTIDTVINPLCNGDTTGSATVNVTGGNMPYTYAWPDGQTTATAVNLGAGTYTVTVDDANMCGPEFAVITITEPTSVIASAVVDQNASCNGFNDGQATASGAGGTPPYSFNWSDGQTNATATGLAAGTYTVTVTDNVGCDDTTSVTITEPTLLTATIATVDPICFGDSTGTATVTAMGGTPAYTYNWNTGDITAAISNLAAGTYTVTVSDANGCDTIVSTTINNPDSIAITVNAITSPSCFCEGDGGIDIDVVGGTAPYTYFWGGTTTALDTTNPCAANFVYYYSDNSGGNANIYEVEISANGEALMTQVASVAGGGRHIAIDPTTNLIYLIYGNGTGLEPLNPATGTVGTFVPVSGLSSTPTAVFTETGELLIGDNADTIWQVNVTTGAKTFYAAAEISGGDIGFTQGGQLISFSRASGGRMIAVNPGGANVVLGSIPSTTTGAARTADGNFLLSSSGDDFFALYDENANFLGTTYPALLGGAPFSMNAGDMAGRAFANLFNWDGDTTAQDLDSIPFGFYTVTVVDANGCSNTLDSIFVDQPDELMASIDTVIDVLCGGDSTGSATVAVTGGTMPYTYAWPDGQTTATATGLATGTYVVTVDDANGCGEELVLITIDENPQLIASITGSTDAFCFGDSSGTATATATGGIPPYTFDWSSGESGATEASLAAGTYVVTVTDSVGCTDTATVTIGEPDSLIATMNINQDNICSGDSIGILAPIVTGGTPAYTFLWSDGSTDSIRSNLAPGTYTVTVTDANGCADTASSTLAAPTVLMATLSTTDLLCAGDSSGSAQVSVTGGTLPYTFNWSNGDTDSIAENLAAGVYGLTVADANGCDTIFNSITITQPDSLIVSVNSITNVGCFCEGDGAIDIDVVGGTAPFTYFWGGTSTSLGNGNPCALNFSYYYSNNNGGTNDIYRVEVNGGDAIMTLVASNSGNSHIAINPMNNLVYLVNNDGSGFRTLDPASGSLGTLIPIAGIGNTPAAAFSSDGKLFVGDSQNDIIYEINTTTGAATFFATGDISGGDLGFTPGGQMVIFSRSGNLIAVNPAGNTIIGPITNQVTGASLTANGTFILSTTGGMEFIEIDTFGVATGNTFDALLMGGAFTMDAGDMAGRAFANLFNWDGDSTAQDLDSIPAGFYTVTVLDGNGCTFTLDSIEVTQPDDLQVGVINVNDALCNGDSTGFATVVVSGGTMPYTYAWPDGQTTATATGLPAGVYVVTVDDANMCGPEQVVVEIDEPTLLVATIDSTTDVFCNGDSTGVAIVSATGGTPGYNFLWSDGQTDSIATGLTSGTYTVTTTDANGCTDIDSITINQAPAITLTIDTFTNVLCNGDSTGTATALATGGTPPYTYFWSTGETGATEGSLAAGTYTVLVVDSLGCTDTASVTITEPAVLDVTIVSFTDVLCNGDSTGTATAAATGGTMPYTYDWSTGESGATEGSLAAGTFTVTVTDANGCTDTTSVTINEPTVLVADITATVDETCIGFADGSATVGATGGTPAYTFNWSTGGTNAMETGLTAGTYTVTTTDANGCTDVDTVVIITNDTIAPVITCPADITVGNDAGVCGAVVTFLDPTFTDNCPGGSVSQTAGLASGATFPVGVTTNTFVATDSIGNTATCSFTVTVNDVEDPVISCAASNQVVDNDLGICGAVVTYPTPTATDNCAGVTVALVSGFPSGSTFPVGVTTTTYVATDSSGNTDTCTFTITVNDTTAPVVVCPADINVSTDAGACSAVVNYTVSATDNCPGETVAQIAGLASGSSFPVGMTVNTYVATDASGNTDTCSFMVTVSDTSAPVIACPSDITAIADSATCDVIVTYPAVIFADNCPGSTITQIAGIASGSAFPEGTTTNVFVASDVNGNTDTCSFDVIVLDLTVPVITCPADIIILNDSGSCGAVVTFPAATATDACGIATIVQSDFTGFVSGDVFPVGTTTIEYTATDINGNIATCSFNVVVNDTTAPLITCPSDIVIGTDSAVCQAVVNYSVTFNDNCPGTIVTITSGFESGETFPIGTTTNTFVITDASGNSSTCSFDVTVVDDERPLLDCPSNITVSNDLGQCGAVVTYAAPTATDNCGVASLLQTDATGLMSGSLFPVGTTSLQYTATDAEGNFRVCNFTVTVIDTSAPAITCPANVAVSNDPGICGAVVNFTTPTGADNCPGATVAQTAGLASGATFPVGTTTNSFTVTDASGNSTSCSFTVTVADTSAPSIVCSPDITVSNDAGICGAAVLYAAPTATDNCSVMSINQTDGTGLTTGSVFPVGVTVQEYTVMDTSGNTSVCSFTVTVLDTTAPTITCNADITVSNDAGQCGALVTYPVPVENDLCAVATVLQTDASGLTSGDIFPIGTTVQEYTVTDTSGNTAVCSFTVTVQDNEAPVVTCVPSIIQAADPGVCGAIVNFADATATDNCRVDTVYQLTGLPSGSFFPTGTSSISYIAIDTVGNSDTCTFNITITYDSIQVTGISLNRFLCEGSSDTLFIDVTGAQPITYQWTLDGDTIAGATDSVLVLNNITDNDAGIYNVQMSNNCSDLTSSGIVIGVLNAPIANAGMGDTICAGETALLTASGGFTYEWSNGANTFATVVSPLVTTTYVVTVTDTNVCPGVDSVTVVVNPLPNATIAATDTVTCEGSAVTFSAGGGVSYNWGFGLTGDKITLFIDDTTDVTVLVTDSNGCQNTATITIFTTQPAGPLDFTGLDSIYCNTDDVVVLTGIPAGGTFTGVGVTDSAWSPKGLLPGAYSVSYTGPDGCDSITKFVRVEVCTGIADVIGEEHDVRVYPNPFTSHVTFEYDLDRATEVSLKVYDMAGREINIIDGEMQTAGHKVVKWNNGDRDNTLVARGMYFFRLTIGDQTYIHKLVYTGGN